MTSVNNSPIAKLKSILDQYDTKDHYELALKLEKELGLQWPSPSSYVKQVTAIIGPLTPTQDTLLRALESARRSGNQEEDEF